MSVTMNSVINAIRSLLDKNEYKYDFSQEKNLFFLEFRLSKTKIGSMTICIRLKPDVEDASLCRAVSAYGYVDTKADDSCMAEVCEYLTRANYGITLGNFELDHEDGEIRYKVAFNCKDAMPGDDAIDDLIALPVWAFNRYGNGILAVSMGLQTAKEAYEAVEKN